MKRYLILLFAHWLLLMALPSLSQGQEDSSSTNGEAKQGEIKMLGLALGLRSTYFMMQGNRGEIFRNITLLDEEQTYIPYKPLLEFDFLNYWGIELSFDQFRAATLNRAFDIYPEHDRRWTDGWVKWSPLMLTLHFRWPFFHNSIVPYVLGGVSYTKTNWDRNDWYYYGFPSQQAYADWINQGNRPEDYPNAGYRRIFATDDYCIGTLVGAGVDYIFSKHWSINLDWRYHWAQVNFTYTLAYNEGQDVVGLDGGTFNLNSWILGLGMKFLF